MRNVSVLTINIAMFMAMISTIFVSHKSVVGQTSCDYTLSCLTTFTEAQIVQKPITFGNFMLFVFRISPFVLGAFFPFIPLDISIHDRICSIVLLLNIPYFLGAIWVPA